VRATYSILNYMWQHRSKHNIIHCSLGIFTLSSASGVGAPIDQSQHKCNEPWNSVLIQAIKLSKNALSVLFTQTCLDRKIRETKSLRSWGWRRTLTDYNTLQAIKTCWRCLYRGSHLSHIHCELVRSTISQWSWKRVPPIMVLKAATFGMRVSLLSNPIISRGITWLPE
jgi:hypothetical protein